MRVLQINSTVNYGSTGKIVENIGEFLVKNNHESYVAFGRNGDTKYSNSIKIGSNLDQFFHLVNTRLFDQHGLNSRDATSNLFSHIKKINPDVIHLHNIHGYYVNFPLLFEFLCDLDTPVVWTLHDCWAFTGHCCHYERVKCQKWKTGCFKCPLKFLYPQSFLMDNSKSNYQAKKRSFNLPKCMHLVSVSQWLENQVKESFLKKYPVSTIYNGVNLNIFKPKEPEILKQKYFFDVKTKIILGVANIWSDGKGLNTFLELSKIIPENQMIVLIGLKKDQIKNLPGNVIGISRTSNIQELAEYYALADVFVSPSLAETFGMVIAEAMACGTPSVVYDSTAMPELIDSKVGLISPVGDYKQLNESIQKILCEGKSNFSSECRVKALDLFDKENQLKEYLALYQALCRKN